MRFTPTPLPGATLVDLEPRSDERGFFARLFCAETFAAQGLVAGVQQINTSLSARRGTLRGMHYQLAPAAEAKLVRCLSGALWDAVLDLRPDSPAFGRWFGAELSAANRRMMVVPRGCAHGFVTLSDDVEALYLVSQAYDPTLERGVRWSDPTFGIGWPMEPIDLSAKDAAWPDFDAAGHGVERLRGLL